MCGANRTAIPHFQILGRIDAETYKKPNSALELAGISLNPFAGVQSLLLFRGQAPPA